MNLEYKCLINCILGIKSEHFNNDLWDCFDHLIVYNSLIRIDFN